MLYYYVRPLGTLLYEAHICILLLLPLKSSISNDDDDVAKISVYPFAAAYPAFLVCDLPPTSMDTIYHIHI